jgi:hypothetical protein
VQTAVSKQPESIPPDLIFDRDTQQLICVSEPFCKCVGDVNEWNECDCFAYLNRKECASCGATMILIDFETGEEIR